MKICCCACGGELAGDEVARLNQCCHVRKLSTKIPIVLVFFYVVLALWLASPSSCVAPALTAMFAGQCAIVQVKLNVSASRNLKCKTHVHTCESEECSRKLATDHIPWYWYLALNFADLQGNFLDLNMLSDHSWMYHLLDNNGFPSNDFMRGVKEFLYFAFSQINNVFENTIRCPCFKCDNKELHTRDIIFYHLLSRGFTSGYYTWFAHGEFFNNDNHHRGESSQNVNNNLNEYQRMVMDAGFHDECSWNENDLNNDNCFEETPNPGAARFFSLLKDADEEVWEGCTTHSKLSAVSQLLNCKSESNMSDATYDRLMSIIKELLPKGDKLPSSFYRTKKMMSKLGLSYQKIHACVNNCMLFYKETDSLLECSVCGHPRYKSMKSIGQRQKGIPFKVLRYLPLTLRVRMLYMSSKTAEHMTWHAFNLSPNGELRHPVDGEAWKHFDRTYLSFANERIEGFGVTHNWVKKSIFWELGYWQTNLVRHNLDVMHVEKNVFDNVFNTVMDVKGKTKDNLKARMDLQLYCKRPELELQTHNGKVFKPIATYALSSEHKKLVCQWVKQIRFPDGYASNIGHCVDVEKSQIFGLKSHDCHVFMQRLLPIAFCDFLPRPIWDALTELSHFFRDLRSTELRVEDLEILEKNSVEILRKLEKIFPPSFFDSMKHLVIHLAYEAKICGPVHYRWMYPFERFLHHLKKKVRNRNCVEGSICEAYLIEEISTFCSHYFEINVQTRLNRVPRNDDGGDVDPKGRLSIFTHAGQSFGPTGCRRYLTDDEYNTAVIYVLMNCEEIAPFIEKFDEEVRSNDVDSRLYELASGPSHIATFHKGFNVNGFKFHTEQYGEHKKTMNSGVWINGSCYNDNERDFYGVLVDIVELEYLGEGNKLMLFKCRWFDVERGVQVHPRHGLVKVNHKSRLVSDEPFVLAAQAQQVCYSPYPLNTGPRKDWWVVFKVKARSRYDGVPNRDVNEVSEVESVYQVDRLVPSPIRPSKEIDREGILNSGYLEEVDVIQGHELEEGEESGEESKMAGGKLKFKSKKKKKQIQSGANDRPIVNETVVQQVPTNQESVELSNLLQPSTTISEPSNQAATNPNSSTQPSVEPSSTQIGCDGVVETDDRTREDGIPRTSAPKRKGRGPSRGTVTPSDPSMKTRLTILDGSSFAQEGVIANIGSKLREHYNQPWPTWSQFEKPTKDLLWERFKAIYIWDKDDESLVYKIWNMKCDERLRDGLGKARDQARKKVESNDWNLMKPFNPKWIPPPVWVKLIDDVWSKKEWEDQSEQASANRKSSKDGCISKHAGGSRPFSKHKQDLKEENNGQEPTEWEVFQRTHIRENGSFVDSKSKDANDKYKSLVVEKYGQEAAETKQFDANVWKSAGGVESVGNYMVWVVFRTPKDCMGRRVLRIQKLVLMHLRSKQCFQMKKSRSFSKKLLDEQLAQRLQTLGYRPIDPPISGGTEVPSPSIAANQSGGSENIEARTSTSPNDPIQHRASEGNRANVLDDNGGSHDDGDIGRHW
ncbi:Transposon, En/Spm-like protein [Corchorus capsularis]|uniref:Transposon, En/Spm-like protein n=1 Tax=Corchorus capsularis TaxID=210143 RepID=A0A1R3GJU0_COCAP|nr:Transposon, En/Spm-like protein [Corchorus capsularis]